MSNLLNEAIVDAKALREAALKNAETIVIEKYSNDVKETLEKLLEQEDDLDAMLGGGDPAADPAAADPAAAAPTELSAEPAMEEEVAPEGEEISEDDIPFAATDDLSELDGKNLDSFLKTGEETELNIDLGALQESLEALVSGLEEAELEEDEEISLEELLSEDEDEDDGAEAEAEETEAEADEDADAPMEEDMDFDAITDAIMEKLTVDMGADLSGWAGRSSDDMKYQIEKELAHRRSTDVQEELEALKKAQEELVFENNQIKEHNNEYKQAFQELKENLQDVNLSNARLLYTNRVLRNTSLNERQKDKIAEAISSAGSVTEAKTIFETLQSTVEEAPRKSPKSLSEAIGRRSTVLRATRQETPASDPLQDRMKKLAGIK
tara:strand:+ start:1264 stop:2406 length:1143 start_codon:yes stop_codon:yes gene_type:complete